MVKKGYICNLLQLCVPYIIVKMGKALPYYQERQ